MSCTAVAQLRTLAINGFLSLPKRGKEIGGLLLGRVQPGDRMLVNIDAFEEIPCEYRYGPSYILSESDRSVLKKVLALRRPDGSPNVIGFYRSYTRRDPELDATDQDLFQSLFPQDDSTFLLIEPLSPRECFATFLFREKGNLPARSPYSFFLFDSKSMQSEPPAATAAAGSRIPEERPARPASPEPAAPVQPAATPPTVERPPAPVLAQEGAIPPQPAPEPLRPVPAPAFAALKLPPPRRRILTQGETSPAPRRRIFLPLLAVILLSVGAAGIYELWRLAHEPQWAELRLDATQAGGQIELSWDHAAPVVELASRGVLSVSDGPSHQNIELSSADLHSGKYTYRPSHSDVLFRMALYGNGIKPWSDSLRVVSLAPAEPVKPPAGTATAAAPAATPVGEASRVEPPPDRPSQSPALVSTAAPTHEVQPHIPAGIRSRIDSRMVIPVEVKIDQRGRVTSAVSPEKGTGLHRYLAEASIKAARSWRFTPAKSGEGKAVSSRKTLQFVFAPAGEE